MGKVDQDFFKVV